MASINYYIFTKSGDLYYLDAALSATRQGKGKVSSYPVEEGFQVSDNVVVEGQVITLAGVISDVKTARNENIPAREFVDKLTQLRQSKELVDVYSGSITSVTNLTKNCFITSLNFSQDQRHGIYGPKENASYTVSISFKEVRISRRAEQVTLEVTVQEEVEDVVAEETEKDVTVREKGDDWVLTKNGWEKII